VVPDGPPSSEGQLGLAKAVRMLREKAELSQAALAERADLPEARIALIESAEEDPPWGDIRRIAQALGVSLEALSELAEQQEMEREV
jgi:transcriptional regulator with XRE-family HTH domain